MLIKEKVLSIIDQLTSRPEMFLKNAGFIEISEYAYALIYGTLIMSNNSKVPTIENWFYDNITQTSNSGWAWHILNIMANGEEERACKVLSEILREYIHAVAEIENWFNNEAIPFSISSIPRREN